MSYPPVLYDGDGGEVGGTFRPADTPREVNNNRGGGVGFLATGDLTGGHFGLYRYDMGPGPGGPDPHFHRTVTESFYVLSGTVRRFDGEHWVDAKPGDFHFTPVGGIHAFKNESGEPASMLILFTPGAPREDYFRTTGTEGAIAAMSPEEKVEFYLRHDNYFL
jgi:mannose-6-phosphate isomerase-like protein (cupin superfamily)